MTRLQRFGADLWLADGPTVDSFRFPIRPCLPRGEEEMVDLVGGYDPSDPTRGSRHRARGRARSETTPTAHLQPARPPSAFPSAESYAPPGLAPKRADLSFAAELGDERVADWGADIDHVIVHGSRAMEEVVFVHSPSSTCIVGDLIQRHDPEAFAGWKRAAMKLDDLLGPEGSTPREWRASFVRRKPGREALKHILAWEPTQLVIAHGTCVGSGSTESAGDVLAKGLSWLSRSWPA